MPTKSIAEIKADFDGSTRYVLDGKKVEKFTDEAGYDVFRDAEGHTVKTYYVGSDGTTPVQGYSTNIDDGTRTRNPDAKAVYIDDQGNPLTKTLLGDQGKTLLERQQVVFIESPDKEDDREKVEVETEGVATGDLDKAKEIKIVAKGDPDQARAIKVKGTWEKRPEIVDTVLSEEVDHDGNGSITKEEAKAYLNDKKSGGMFKPWRTHLCNVLRYDIVGQQRFENSEAVTVSSQTGNGEVLTLLGEAGIKLEDKFSVEGNLATGLRGRFFPLSVIAPPDSDGKPAEGVFSEIGWVINSKLQVTSPVFAVFYRIPAHVYGLGEANGILSVNSYTQPTAPLFDVEASAELGLQVYLPLKKDDVNTMGLQVGLQMWNANVNRDLPMLPDRLLVVRWSLRAM